MSQTTVQQMTVAPDDSDVRLDRWFARHFPGLGHGRLEKLLRTGQVRLDGRRVKASARLAPGQVVRVPPGVGDEAPKAQAHRVPPNAADKQWIRQRVIHQDDDLVVIDKPSGLAVQGGSRQHRHVDRMISAFGREARLVHRLDKDTSGLLVIARNVMAARWLSAAFRGDSISKIYWAVVVGAPKSDEGLIDQSLSKQSGRAGERMSVHPGGKTAQTRYRTLDTAAQKAALLALEPLTGRTHQLRVHCAALGTPILGDGKYGGKQAFIGGLGVAKQLHLHARAIRIKQPSGRDLALTAPLPDYFAATLAALGLAA